jgi:PAS domain S-box-containing protein
MIKILAIDDINDNLISLKAIIYDAFPDSVVFTALNGSKGIELAIANDPDVILLDIVMPEMDGFKVCHYLKHDEQVCDIPVVFITALKGDKANRIKALEAGAEAFISKPIDETELTVQIRAMVKIKAANVQKRDEKANLERLVAERTQKLELSQIATFHLLNELESENEAHRITEAALNESIQLFHGLFNVSPDAIILIDPHHPTISWPIVDCNVAACKMNGYSHDELVGHSIDILNEIEGSKEERIAYFEELREKGTIHKEVYHRRKDGSIFTIEVLSSIVTLGGKEMVLGIDRDISERKRTEDALRESQTLYHSFVENMPAGVFRKDNEGRYIFVNTVFCQLKGLKANEIIGKTSHELEEYEATRIKVIKPDQQTLINSGDNHHEFIMRTGIPIELEEVYENMYGSNQYLQVVKSPVFSSNGKVIGSQGIQFDITERKNTEIELIESNELNNSLLKTIPFGMDIVDEYGNILFQSENLERIFGKNFNGKKCWQLYRDNQRQCSECPLKAGINIGETAIFETSGVLGGKTFQISHTGMLFKGKKAMLEIFQDITEKKQMLDDLIAAKENAEESDRLKSAFLANMSHEIRTPLNSIIGFSDLMLDPFFGPDKHGEFASIIKENGNNLLTIISDIMDLSKIEAGQVQIYKEALSVNQLITDIQLEYSFKAIGKGIELILDPLNPKEDIIIESDYERLRQILINFISNAIKFTEKGLIEIGTKTTGEFVQFHVKDTGIGIPKEFHNKVFERFRQVESAHTRKYGGNGLGLPISKSLVELLGGKIWMESEQGKGSTFFFTIPK